MRIAVLITGLPRFIDQSAWWLRNKTFPPSYHNLQVDYYCHLWDDYTGDLLERATALYQPKGIVVEDFESVIKPHIDYIKEQNSTVYTDWTGVPTYAQENFLFNTHEPTPWGKNYHGQYLSTYRGSLHFASELRKYDMVIKTRSDCIIFNMEERKWLESLGNINRNRMFRNTLFANWLYIKSGVPFHGDWVFIGRPEIWLQYGLNIDIGLKKLCTERKQWFEETGEEFGHEPVHWIWNKLNYFSKNDWLSFAVAWPTNFSCTLVRQPDVVYGREFAEIDAMYWQEKYSREQKRS